MNCKTADTWIQKSLDGRLDDRSRERLEEHLKACPSCRKAEAEYKAMRALLRPKEEATPLPRFWERLEPRLREEQKIVPIVLWERWALRAIPAFVALAALAAGLFLFTPQTREMSQSETLLIENANPFTETRSLFEEKRPEARSMMLIFASLDDKSSVRRPLP